MTDRLSIDRLRTSLSTLFELHRHRAAEQQRIREKYESQIAAARKQHEDLERAAQQKLQQDKRSLELAYDAAQRKAAGDFRTQQAAAELKYEQDRKDIDSEFTEQQRQAEARLTQETWEATTVFDARQPALAEQLAQVKSRIAAQNKTLSGLLQAAADYLILCRQQRLLVGDETLVETEPTTGDPFQQLADCVQSADLQLKKLKGLSLPRLFIGQRAWALFPALWLPLAGLAVLALGQPLWMPIAGAAVLAAVGFAFLLYWLKRRATHQLSEAHQALRQSCEQGKRLQEMCLAQAQSYFESQRLKSVAKRDRELQSAREKFSRATSELGEQRAASLRQLEQARAERQIAVAQRRDAALANAHDQFPQLLEESEAKHNQTLAATNHALEQALADATARRNADTAALVEHWRSGMLEARATINFASAENERLFPSWSSPRWSDWQPPASAPPAIRFGEFQVDVGEAGAGSADDERFAMGLPGQLSLPALLPFPTNASLLIKASGEGKRQAIDAVQAVMLRMLSTIPPGKLKFTIIDPVGLGENFAGFMHLADYDESLIANRIWTEPAHIEQRLTDLTEQMENVIQKYLRNDFRSIEEYNAFAGEVAESFRVLVVANFPVNFTEAAARRLSSIVSSGARCGVFTLITTDAKQPLPAKFDLADIERQSTTVAWSAGRFIWKDPDLGRFPLQLDIPPLEDQFSKIVHNVGESTKSLQRVEVPFEYIAPPVERYWTGDASTGIDVPLGRIGATKLQHLRLGRGTAQHVLVAGKTGSGKSTLLHALVTNLSLIYSPQEVELYLVDFKKGVEFKTYATHQLPHARVIAVESEREFGLSVLERLDAELKQRGDQYRALGVQDLAAYRAADPATPMPRVLLVVDEFQELFVEDDRLAQQSALLLDRLVRQGRAFGIHVLLGSQTLGGAYTLARSTIGQMAVRIALQCSESDAHLILSDDNSAARLLSRPGEAIYNDANGLIEGNSPFQVVWLADERREHYLQQIQELARQRSPARGTKQIVFDGHQAADLRGNALLEGLISNGESPAAASQAWLGDAVAIKDPTAAVLRRQGGANLLIVGQQEEAARGMLAAALLSLAAQHPSPDGQRSGAQFYILEAPREATGNLQLKYLSAIVPHTMHVVGRRDEGAVMAELAAEVAHRQEDDQRAAPPIFLFVFDLARFRELRRSDDDLGFSFGGESRPPSPARLFGTILRDGPEVGIHTLVWCDSAASLARVFDRQAMREFDLRVLFQMSSSDSSQLIDTPLAGKLGAHYALLHDEEAGRLEKFRPYGWPDPQWLSFVAERLKQQGTASDPLAT